MGNTSGSEQVVSTTGRAMTLRRLKLRGGEWALWGQGNLIRSSMLELSELRPSSYGNR
jgi:hypothetical protein